MQPNPGRAYFPRLSSGSENVAVTAPGDGETGEAQQMTPVPKTRSQHAPRKGRRCAHDPVTVLAMARSYYFPVGVLILGSSCVRMVGAITAEARQGRTAGIGLDDVVGGRDAFSAAGSLQGSYRSPDSMASIALSYQALTYDSQAASSLEGFDKDLIAGEQAASENFENRLEGGGSAPSGGPKYLAASWKSPGVPVDVLGMRQLAENGSNDGQSPNNNKDGDTEQNSSNSGSSVDDSTEMLLIIWIVVGCGIVTLVVLCIVRKVMDLCMFRNDPTGAIRYSQEEGLAKAVIERLPQARYKSPPTKPKHGKKAVQDVSVDHSLVEGALGPAAAPLGTGTGTAAPAVPDGSGDLEAGAATKPAKVEGEDRDSTEDMCAICLIDYEPGDMLRVLPGCRHHFHKECIDPWLETKAVCAYCKAKVEPKKSICGRICGWLGDRLNIHPVAPSTFEFSSTRRTFTNREVQLMMEPALPPAYRRSDMDYVGSMVAPRPPGEEGAGIADGVVGPTGGLRAASFTSSAAGVVRTDNSGAVGGVGGSEDQGGLIVVQPASAPSFTVVPRESAPGPADASTSGAASTAPGPLPLVDSSSALATDGGGGGGGGGVGVGPVVGGVNGAASGVDGVSASEGTESGEEKTEEVLEEERLEGRSDHVGLAASGIVGGALESKGVRAGEAASLEGDTKAAETAPGEKLDEVEVSEEGQLQDVPL